ncbi:MAG: hypothetical protein U0900_23465 [Myxococcota bacterium]
MIRREVAQDAVLLGAEAEPLAQPGAQRCGPLGAKARELEPGEVARALAGAARPATALMVEQDDASGALVQQEVAEVEVAVEAVGGGELRERRGERLDEGALRVAVGPGEGGRERCAGDVLEDDELVARGRAAEGEGAGDGEPARLERDERVPTRGAPASGRPGASGARAAGGVRSRCGGS